MKKQYLTICALLIFTVTHAQFTIDLESGAATFGYNDVRIPGNSGTLFSLSENFENKLSPFFRARAHYTFNKRHTILALYAPFVRKSAGVVPSTIRFQDELFEAGDKINATWKFNSYRLSYQYHLIAREKFTFAIGLTGKIRDAKIALQNSTAFEATCFESQRPLSFARNFFGETAALGQENKFAISRSKSRRRDCRNFFIKTR